MKIALISPNKENLHDMAAVLLAHSHQPIVVEGGKSKMRPVAEQHAPDLMLVEGMCCDADELAQVEYVATHHPKIAVVLLCSTHTPEFLIQAMRAGVREVLPSPASADALTAMVSRLQLKLNGAPPRAPGKVLAFVPCKGGSGATFLSTNIGHHLAQSHSVLLIDLNLQFGDALGVLHDGRPAATLADVARNIARLDASLLAASTVAVAPKYNILAAPEDPSQSVEIKPEHIESIVELAASQFDFVLLDMGRSIDPLSIRAFDRADRIYPVLQQSLPSIRNAAKLLEAFRALGYARDKLEVIVNRHEKSSRIGLTELKKSLGEIEVRTVPNSYRDVNSSIDHGTPLVTQARSNPVVRSLVELAESLRPQPGPGRSLLERILKRA